MKRNGWNQVMRGALLIALLALPLPATAGAQSATPEAADAPAGITVTGIGFAGTEALAADQAIRDATDRAATVAATLGVGIGTIESVEMPELTQFTRFSQRCERGDRQAKLCRRKAAAAIVRFGILGGATGDVEAMRTVTAGNTVSVSVERRDPPSDRWIKRAIATAREEAMKSATVAARQKARIAATAADLKLGPIVSVTEIYPSPIPFLPSLDLGFRDPLLGFFGPGTYCGIATRPVLRVDLETGKRKIVRVKRRRCVVPSTYETRMEVRYAVS